MSRIFRKLVSIMLALLMVISTIGVPVLAEEQSAETVIEVAVAPTAEPTPAPVQEVAVDETEETEEPEEPTEAPVEEETVDETEAPIEEETEGETEEVPTEETVDETETPDEETSEEPVEDPIVDDEAVSEAMIAANELLSELSEKYGCEYTDESYEACMEAQLAGMDEAAMAEYLDDTSALAVALSALTDEELEQLESDYAALLAWLADMELRIEILLSENQAVEAVRTQLSAFDIPEYTEDTLWDVIDEVIAEKIEDDTLEAYLDEIADVLDALNGLSDVYKIELEAEFAVELGFIRLLPVKFGFDGLVDDYYREFDDELWILFETMLALMDTDELCICYEDLIIVLSVIDDLPDAEKVLFEAHYADELDYMFELYEAVNEKASKPELTAVSKSWFDTGVTDSYYNIISEKHYALTAGADEAEIVMNNSDGTRRQVVHVFKVDSTKVDVVSGYYGVDQFDPEDIDTWKAAGVTTAAKYYEEELGYELVGGMNTGLSYDCNAPYSFFVYEGEVLQDANSDDPLMNLHSGKCATYLAVNYDGTCELRSSSEKLTGNERFAVGANFGWVVRDGALVTKTVERTSDPAARSMLGIMEDGTLIMCMVDGRGANNSIGLSNYEEGECMLALGCKYALNCDGGGSSSFVSRREGESGLTMRCVPCDGAERPTLNSVFIAKKKDQVKGVFDHVTIYADYDYFVPNSEYTFTVKAFDTTGSEIDMPDGCVWSLSDTSFGTIDENGKFVSNGRLGDVTISYTANDTTDEYTITIQNPSVARFTLDSTVLPYGKSTPLTLDVWADEDGELPMYFQVDSFDLSVSNEDAGTLDLTEFNYTATTDESISGVTITAEYKYAEMDALTFVITFGKGSEILEGWDFEDGDVSDWMGFTEARQWSIDHDVNNTLVGSNPLAGQFSPMNSAYTFLATSSNGQVKNGKYALGVGMDYSNGEFNGWCYNILFNVGEAHVLRDVENGINATNLGMWLYIPEGATGLSWQSQLYVKNADGTLSCKQDHFTFKTVTGATKNLNSCTEADIPASRWVYASIDLTGYDYIQTCDPYDESNSRSPSFLRTYIKPAGPSVLTFYIDDITLDYSTAVDDREAPIIGDIMYATSDTSIAAKNATITGSAATFSASVVDDMTKTNYTGLDVATAQIYLDGVTVETKYENSTMYTANSIAMGNGTHVVTFEIADNQGNYTQKSVSFTVKASDDAALITVSGHNDSGKAPEYDSVYYVDIKTSDIEQVEYLEAHILLNTANTWELEQMYIAPGFEVEYAMLADDRDYVSAEDYGVATTALSENSDIHSVENVVWIMLSKTDDCTLTGEQVLASLPIRVWSWNGVDNVTGADGTVSNYPTVTIDYDVRFGCVETVDGDTFTFSGGDSVETALKSGIKSWHSHDEGLTVLNQAATCLTNGYSNRTYCETCQSVIDWGTLIPATGHSYTIVDDALVCETESCGYTLTGTGIVKTNDKLYCLIADRLVTGWQLMEEGWCYADSDTFEVHVGEATISGLSYIFDSNGILTKGVWVVDSTGTKYSYGPGFYTREWREIDGATYYFGTDSYMYTGIRAIPVNRNNIKEGYKLYDFGTDGKMTYDYADYNGIVVSEVDGMFYLKDGLSYYGGLMYLDTDSDGKPDAYYYARTSGMLVCSKSYWITKNNDLLPIAKYTFGDDGKMIDPPVTEETEDKNGIVEDDGVKYWYVDGEKTYGGLLYLDTDSDGEPDAYYYARTTGEIICGKSYWITKNNDLLPVGKYSFDADGKMIDPPVTEEPDEPEVKNGIIEENGTKYWYVDDVKTYGGLLYLDTDGDGEPDTYYYARTTGEIICGKSYWITKTNDLLPTGWYTFDGDGKMIISSITE